MINFNIGDRFVGKIKAMHFRFKHLLLFLFFIMVFLACVTANYKNEISQRIRAPHENVENNVMNSTGTKKVISF